MKIKSLGHVVLRVTDRDRAERFYGGVLGLPLCARLDEDGFKMAFFSLGNHHDFAVMEVSGEGSSRSETAVGLHHVAFNIGTTLEELSDRLADLGRHNGCPVAITVKFGCRRARRGPSPDPAARLR